MVPRLGMLGCDHGLDRESKFAVLWECGTLFFCVRERNFLWYIIDRGVTKTCNNATCLNLIANITGSKSTRIEYVTGAFSRIT